MFRIIKTIFLILKQQNKVQKLLKRFLPLKKHLEKIHEKERNRACIDNCYRPYKYFVNKSQEKKYKRGKFILLLIFTCLNY